jgi:hypothetical protein
MSIASNNFGLLGIALARTPEVDGSDADQQQAQIEG